MMFEGMRMECFESIELEGSDILLCPRISILPPLGYDRVILVP